MAEYDRELDASGLNCPLPILRAKKTLSDMQSGSDLANYCHRPRISKGF